MSRVLQRQEPQFLRRNTFVHGCLGLLSLAERCEGAIARELAAPRDGVETPNRLADSEDGDESIVFAVLGALALSRQLRATLARLAPAMAPAAASAPAAAPPLLRHLVR